MEEGRAKGPSIFLGFILKTVATNCLLGGIVESGLCCGYGARLSYHLKFSQPPLSDFS